MQDLVDSALARIHAAATAEELEAVRVEVLGRKGVLTQLSKDMGKLPPEERAAAASSSTRRSRRSKSAYEARASRRSSAPRWRSGSMPSGSISPFPRRASTPGSLHPITQIQWEIEDLFRSLGFTVLDGPEVETEYHNFDALNIPPDHPARDMQDTFWLRRRPSAAHPHVARAGARHGEAGSAAAHDRAGPRLPQ